MRTQRSTDIPGVSWPLADYACISSFVLHLLGGAYQNAGARYSVPFASRAQITLAVLLAMATVARRNGFSAVMFAVQTSVRSGCVRASSPRDVMPATSSLLMY